MNSNNYKILIVVLIIAIFLQLCFMGYLDSIFSIFKDGIFIFFRKKYKSYDKNKLLSLFFLNALSILVIIVSYFLKSKVNNNSFENNMKDKKNNENISFNHKISKKFHEKQKEILTKIELRKLLKSEKYFNYVKKKKTGKLNDLLNENCYEKIVFSDEKE